MYPGLGVIRDGMAGGVSHSPMFRFVAIPKKSFTDRMPTVMDIIRELGNEENFSSKYNNIDLNLEEIPYPGNEHDWSDELHTDHTKQYMFHSAGDGDEEMKGGSADGEDGAEDMKDDDSGDTEDDLCDVQKSIAAHKKLQTYVKHNRLYYAVFHSKSTGEDGSGKPDLRYVVAVVLSTKTLSSKRFPMVPLNIDICIRNMNPCWRRS